VRLQLRPREPAFFDYFRQAADNLVDAARLLDQMVDGTTDRPGIAVKLRDLEHAGDDVTHQLLRKLNSTFVTPFDREDIYRLASSLDDVMDFMEAAADLIVLYKLGELPAEVRDMTGVLVRSAEATAEAMPKLEHPDGLENYWIRINELENEADQVYRHLVAELFSGRYDALDVLKLKEFIDQLEGAADAFEHVANVVETIVVKGS
jgi:uncharacterized protein